ncbi:MAG: hypothetical protein ACC630_02695 [Nitrospinota bacterium]
MDTTDTTQKLRELAKIEAQLVWNRYNAMVVTNAVLIGFLAQLVISENETKMIGILGCVFGLIIALIWWRITGVGWSLAHAYLNAIPNDNNSDPTLEKVYENWTRKFLFHHYQDPIWWSAHGVIAMFYVAYLCLFIYLTREQGIQLYCLILIVGVAIVIFLILFISSLTTLNIRKDSIETSDNG